VTSRTKEQTSASLAAGTQGSPKLKGTFVEMTEPTPREFSAVRCYSKDSHIRGVGLKSVRN